MPIAIWHKMISLNSSEGLSTLSVTTTVTLLWPFWLTIKLMAHYTDAPMYHHGLPCPSPSQQQPHVPSLPCGPSSPVLILGIWSDIDCKSNATKDLSKAPPQYQYGFSWHLTHCAIPPNPHTIPQCRSFSPVWVLMWSSKVLLFQSFLLHTSHIHFIGLLWTRWK